jgi:hypothetical protein
MSNGNRFSVRERKGVFGSSGIQNFLFRIGLYYCVTGSGNNKSRGDPEPYSSPLFYGVQLVCGALAPATYSSRANNRSCVRIQHALDWLLDLDKRQFCLHHLFVDCTVFVVVLEVSSVMHLELEVAWMLVFWSLFLLPPMHLFTALILFA